MNWFGLWWGPVWDARDSIISGTIMTVAVSAIVIPLACLIGIAIALSGYISGKRGQAAVTLYVELMRNNPSLVKMYFIYYGLPTFGIYPTPIVAGVAALVLHNSAYLAEIFRGGLSAIPAAQIEGARGLGMSTGSIVRDLLLPQAFRRSLPAMSNNWTEIVKDTSLTSAISVKEIFFTVTSMISMTMLSFEFLIIAAAVYLLLTAVLTATLRFVEQSWRYPL